MPPRHRVEQLPAEQFEFLLREIAEGGTDRSISLKFEAEFKVKLSKSALARWRAAAGDELADRYRFVRYQAKQLQEDLQLEDADKYKIVIENIEDRLLTASKEIISRDPIALLNIQQEEKRRALRERELQLKERAQSFAEEQARKSDQLQQDRLKIGVDVWRITLAYLLKADPAAADHLTKHSEGILSAIQENLETETA
ncbi:MAG TPA: hypothetical protein VJU84_08660 [Pyrinomonadaceae bacterium]|nr:hypothetical protein [Pyrinomonadaceae bacterium]